MNQEEYENWLVGCLILGFALFWVVICSGCVVYNKLVNPLNISIPKEK